MYQPVCVKPRICRLAIRGDFGEEQRVGAGLGRERIGLEHGHVRTEFDALSFEDVEFSVKLLPLLADILQVSIDISLIKSERNGGLLFSASKVNMLLLTDQWQTSWLQLLVFALFIRPPLVQVNKLLLTDQWQTNLLLFH